MFNFVETLFRCLKKYYWIGCSDNNHLKGIKVIEGLAEEKDMQECIYFELREDADMFLKEIKKFIKENYKRVQEGNWYIK